MLTSAAESEPKEPGTQSPSGVSDTPLALGDWITKSGMRVTCYAIGLERVPADFFADPDGRWTYDSLAEAAGFAAYTGVAVGALKEPWCGHLDGAAVVTLNAESRPYVAIVECPVAYACVENPAELEVSAA
jgi:hypothetical protein